MNKKGNGLCTLHIPNKTKNGLNQIKQLLVQLYTEFMSKKKYGSVS